MDFQELVDVPTWQRMQDAAAASLRVPVFTIDTAGRLLIVSGAMPGYAQVIENRSLLLVSTREKELRERTEGHVYKCPSGMHYAITPVFLNGRLLCALVAGPMRIDQDSENTAISLAKLMGVDTDQLLSELAKMPMQSNEVLAAAQSMVDAFAKILPEATIFRREATQKVGSLQSLLEFSNQLGTQLELDPLFMTTITFCVKQIGMQDAAIWFHDRAMRFSSLEDRNSLCAEVERRLMMQVLSANSVVHIPDARKDFTLQKVPHIEALSNAIYVLPLQVDGKAEGMLALYAPLGTMFSSMAVLLQGVAQRLSASLERAKSLRVAQENAVTDALTGLHNKRFLMEALKNELNRAKQFTRPTTLLIFDIDNFKSFNDTYGHPAGDALLRQMGAIIREHANQIDIACRYGGEEFVLIMPETNPEHAQLRAEKLRSAIAGFPFEHRRCSVSIGMVIAMKSSSSPDSMIKEADKALYTSKKTGKNKVTTVIVVDDNINPIPFS